jgi:hypothetical protein
MATVAPSGTPVRAPRPSYDDETARALIRARILRKRRRRAQRVLTRI